MFRKGRPLSGVVRNLRRAEDAGGSFQAKTDRDQVLLFRLEQSDASAENITYTQVEMRGRVIVGDVADGDRVAVPTSRVSHGVYKPRSIENVTSQSLVYVPTSFFRNLFAVVVLLAFAAFAVFILLSFLSMPSL